MKKILLFIMPLLLFFFWAACKKEPNPPLEEEDIRKSIFKGSALKNGSPWSLVCDIWRGKGPEFFNKFSLALLNCNAAGYKRAAFYFDFVPMKVGIYYPMKEEYNSIVKDTLLTAFFATALSDGDVMGDVYIPIRDSSIVLTIDRLDPTGEVWGTFEGTLIKDVREMEYDIGSPDTLKIEQGKYHAKIKL